MQFLATEDRNMRFLESDRVWDRLSYLSWRPWNHRRKDRTLATTSVFFRSRTNIIKAVEKLVVEMPPRSIRLEAELLPRPER
jgi:hypothetical protein